MAEAEKYTAEQWWASIEEAQAEEQSSGGGVIGKMRIDPGYKVFVTGLTGEDMFKTFFPVVDATKEERAKVLAKARLFAKENGTKRPQWSLAITMYKDECVTLSGETVDWNHNQQSTVSTWTRQLEGPSAAKIFVAAMKEHRAPISRDFYGRIAWVQDPYKVSLGEAGKTGKDADGDPKFPTFANIVDVYKNKARAQAAAEKFAAEAPNNGSAPVEYPWDDFPDSWGEDEDWAEFAKDAEMALLEDGITAADYAEDELGEDLTFLYRALNVGGFDNKKIKKVTGAKMSQIKAALAID